MLSGTAHRRQNHDLSISGLTQGLTTNLQILQSSTRFARTVTGGSVITGSRRLQPGVSTAPTARGVNKANIKLEGTTRASVATAEGGELHGVEQKGMRHLTGLLPLAFAFGGPIYS